MKRSAGQEQKLELIQGILEGGFFSPLTKGDLWAFRFDVKGLLGLEEDEVFDLFIRSSLALQALHPEDESGRSPLARLMGLEDCEPVFAQVLASLVNDRPLLFHRALYSLPAVIQDELNPEDFEFMEDFLRKALERESGLAEAARSEMTTLAARAFRAAEAAGDQAGALAAEQAEKILAGPQFAGMGTETELLMWLGLGHGLDDTPPELRPETMVEVWRRWVGAVLGTEKDPGLLARLYPELTISAAELELYAPPNPEDTHIISAQCPFCSQVSTVRVTPQPEKLAGCDHLAYVGTNDEVHLLEVVGRFDLGQDFKALLASYYDSPVDHHLFADIVNDLFEMFSQQGRLHTTPVACQSAPRSFYNLRAYFIGSGPELKQTH